LAYSKLFGIKIENISAAFHYVGSNETVLLHMMRAMISLLSQMRRLHRRLRLLLNQLLLQQHQQQAAAHRIFLQ
jgi:hypothetical protein